MKKKGGTKPVVTEEISPTCCHEMPDVNTQHCCFEIVTFPLKKLVIKSP